MVFNRRNEQRAVNDPQQPPQVRPMTPPTPPPRGTTVNVAAESVIGSDLSIEGQSITIRCKGALQINGNIQADVHSVQVVVGEQASISGAVAADVVEVHGKVSGAILGARVVLHQSAQVDGDIHSQLLTIEQGASFDGRSRKVMDANEIAPQLDPPGQSHTPPAQQPTQQSSASPAPISVPLPRLHS